MFSGEFKYTSDLDLSHLKEIFFSNGKKIEPINGNLVLLFGSSKSGKTTFANYMAGCQMDNQEELGEPLIVPKAKETEYVKIGHGAASETSRPQTIPTKHGFEFCDSPSFDDNRLDSVKVCGTLLTQLAIQKSKSMKGIIIFIPYNSFNHLDEFYHNLNAIDQLLRDFSKTDQSILFLVTKAPQKAETKHILARIADAADIEERTGINKKTARALHEMIKKNPQCLNFFRPLDEKQREVILHQIQELKPISKSQFKFPIYDAAHSRFEEMLFEIMIKSTTVFNYRNILKELLSVSLSDKHRARYNRQLQEIEEDINTPLQEEKSDIQFAFKVSEFLNLDPSVAGPFVELYKQFIEDYSRLNRSSTTESATVTTYSKKLMSYISSGSSSVFSYLNPNASQVKSVPDDVKQGAKVKNPPRVI